MAWNDFDDWSKTVSCKYCGKAGLTWEDDGGGEWILVHPNGEVHQCKAETLAKVTAEDFDDLS